MDAIFVECGMDKEHPDPKYQFKRKIFLHPSQIEEFRWMNNNQGIYHTVMHYINPLWIKDEKERWIINAADSLKYGHFYLDFDTVIQSEADYQHIKEDVLVALRYFKLFLGVQPHEVYYFFSGHKGIHLMIDSAILGVEPHIALNQIYKEIAMDIQNYIKHDTLDIKVYDDKRLYRIPNSINKKSGLYKIPLTPEEFQTLTYTDIKKLAEQPRFITYPKPVFKPKAKAQLNKYIEKWNKRLSQQTVYRGKMKELKVLPPCINAMLTKTFRETIDERNNSATALSSFYFQKGISREECLARMVKWGEENCQPPLKQREIATIVNSVYNGQYRYGCETFKRLSGVCDKDHCPLFHKEYNVSPEENQKEKEDETLEKTH